MSILYDFECTNEKCHVVFDKSVRYEDRHSVTCPNCGKEAVLVWLQAPYSRPERMVHTNPRTGVQSVVIDEDPWKDTPLASVSGRDPNKASTRLTFDMGS